jgi:hypothetical protein
MTRDDLKVFVNASRQLMKWYTHIKLCTWLGGKRNILCIIDTCSLVYLKDVTIADRPLHKWLWGEFDVQFSAVVLDELSSFKQKLGFRYNWNDHVWRFSTISNYETAIFSSHQRKTIGGFYDTNRPN